MNIKLSVDTLGSETPLSELISGLNDSSIKNENYFFYLFGNENYIKNMNEKELFKNFYQLRQETLKQVKNHSDFDLLPKTEIKELQQKSGEFIDEFITIKEVDYYFSNSIARASKTMSNCRAEKSKSFKNKTGS